MRSGVTVQLLCALILCFALNSTIASEPSSKTNFEELERIKVPQEIIIRGFLYQSPEGRWILAPEPNLRSCCVGAAHKAESQILLAGQHDPSKINRVITVQGILHREDKQYRLLHAQEVKSTDFSAAFIIFTLLCMSIVGWVIGRRLMSK